MMMQPCMTMAFLVSHDEDADPDKKSQHQQNRYNPCNYDGIHIHFTSPSLNTFD